MKKLVPLLCLMFFVSAVSVASIPVKKSKAKSFKSEKTEHVISSTISDPMTIQDINIPVSEDDMLSPAVAQDMDNDFILTLLLWLFLGGIAAHRWYKKKDPLMNILFILTLGGLGIWWLIDGIKILQKRF